MPGTSLCISCYGDSIYTTFLSVLTFWYVPKYCTSILLLVFKITKFEDKATIWSVLDSLSVYPVISPRSFHTATPFTVLFPIMSTTTFDPLPSSTNPMFLFSVMGIYQTVGKITMKTTMILNPPHHHQHSTLTAVITWVILITAVFCPSPQQFHCLHSFRLGCLPSTTHHSSGCLPSLHRHQHNPLPPLPHLSISHQRSPLYFIASPYPFTALHYNFYAYTCSIYYYPPQQLGYPLTALRGSSSPYGCKPTQPVFGRGGGDSPPPPSRKWVTKLGTRPVGYICLSNCYCAV
jgi:hypothetical protein